MSLMTDAMENALADMVRGQGLTLPTNWDIALLSAADDGSFTELSGTAYARVSVARSLANWAGTQASGSILASTGTSHATSNNNAINFGTSGSAWGTATHVGLFSGGTCWMYAPLPSPIVIGSGDAVSLPAGSVTFRLGLTGGLTDYAANKLIDLIWRGQAYTWPATLYGALYTAAPSNAGGGTEVAAGDYSRPAIAGSLSAWSGTQGAGTTSASSGSGGRISNNAPLTWPTPTTAWGALGHGGLKDALTGGNLMFWAALPAPRTVSIGQVQTLPADTVEITFA